MVDPKVLASRIGKLRSYLEKYCVTLRLSRRCRLSGS